MRFSKKEGESDRRTAPRRVWCLAALGLLLLTATPRAEAQGPSSQITAINQQTGIITAKVNATGQVFEFKLTNKALLQSLKVGQAVYANFITRQVSLDGKIICCQIVNIAAGGAPAIPPPAPGNKPAAAPQPQSRPAPTTQSGVPGTHAEHVPVATSPSGKVAGAPVSVPLPAPTPGAAPPGPQTSGQVVGAKVSQIEVVHLHGVKGIQAAQGLPEPAKQWLLAHAKSLPPGETPVYIVNKQDAVEWSKTHHAPPKPSGGGHHGGGVLGQASGAVEHTTGEVSKAATHAEKEAEKTIKQAETEGTKEWRHLYREASHDFNIAGDLLEKCFEDNPLESPWIPIKYNGTPEFPLPMKSLTTGGSSISGDISGQVTIQVPLKINLYAKAGVFIVPCLQYFNRPRNIAIWGTLTVGSAVVVDIKGHGKLSKDISLPAFPVQILPPTIIMAGPVPILLDGTINLQPKLEIYADAAGEAKFTAQIEQDITLDFECDGHGCHPNHLPQRWARPPIPSDPNVATLAPLQLTVVNGNLGAKVAPSVTALFRLKAYGGLLTASLGPELYLTGDLSGSMGQGCSGNQLAAAQQAPGNVSGLTANMTAGVNFQFGVESLLEVEELGIKEQNFGKVPVTHTSIWKDPNVFNKHFPCQ